MIRTLRLLLRPFEENDLDRLALLLGDPVVMRFSDHGPLDLAAQREWLQRARSSRDAGVSPLYRAVCSRADGTLIGYVSLSSAPNRVADGEAELGFRLAHFSWGQGFATEAARAMIDYAGRLGGIDRIVAIVDPNNSQSARVLEKLGFVYEAEVSFSGYDYPDNKYGLALS